MMKSVLDIQQVSLRFFGLEKPVLDNINYQIYAGDFIIVLGSNGSGKSSLLKLLDQRYQPTSGKIICHGTGSIKTLTQNCNESLFGSLTILENYLLVKKNHNRVLLEDYLMKFNPNLPGKLNQLVDRLSGGEKQALALALTVLHPPRILLLDEHTSALDPHSADTLMELTQKIVQEYNMTCLLTTHDLGIAEQYGNRILSLKNGEIHHCVDALEKGDMTEQHLLTACY